MKWPASLLVFLTACAFAQPAKKKAPIPTPEIQQLIDAALDLPNGKVIPALEKALSRAHQIGDLDGEAACLMAAGSKAGSFGHPDKAIDYDLRALHIERAIGDRLREAITLNNIGLVYDDIAQKQKALDYYRQALPIWSEVGQPTGVAVTLSNIGGVYDDLGQKQTALSYYNLALPIERKVQDRAHEAVTLNNIGAIYDDLGQKQKALDFYNQSLPMRAETHDRAGEAVTLGNIGRVYDDLGQKQKALDYATQALDVQHEIGDLRGEGETLSNIGAVYDSLGQEQKALDYFGRALPIQRAVKDRLGEAATLSDLGRLYDAHGQKERALGFYEQALAIQNTSGDKRGAATALSNVGAVYDALGQRQRALQYYNRSLPIRRAVGDRLGEAVTLNNIGHAYSEMGQTRKALDFYSQALSIDQEIRNLDGQAMTLGNVGRAYADLLQQRKALYYYTEALPLERAVGDRAGEAVTLASIGRAYLDLGEQPLAMDYYAQALPIERAVGDRNSEAWTLSLTGAALDHAGQPTSAILLLKQAVNVYQSLRKDISGLPASGQAAYRDYVAASYRRLADLLIRSGRVVEAEKVLDLLKDSERFEFLRRDSSASPEQQIELVGREQGWFDRWKGLEDRAVEIGSRVWDLQAAKQNAERQGVAFSDAEKLSTAEEDEKAVHLAMTAYFEALKNDVAAQSEELAQIRRRELEEFGTNVVEPLSRLQRSTGQRIAAVYGLVYGGVARFIVATPQGTVPISVNVGEEKLNRAISDLRTALGDPGNDARTAGKRLFDLVLAKPVHQLRAAGIHHVMWALDGAIRTVPLAAVWDGERYLAETESYTVYSPLEIEKLDSERASSPEIAGFGSTQGARIGTETFPPLPNVGKELGAVVRDRKKDSNGVIDGVPWIDREFTKDLFLSQMGSRFFNIAHVASHFDLRSDYEQSALLTGDKRLISLREMLGDQKLGDAMATKPWSHLDLVVLSACDTASSASNAEGESFASVVLGLGAASVMASLWSVSDESTALLMGRFYRNWRSGMTKEEALRQAQLSMIRSSGSGAPSAGRSRNVSASAAASARYSHPYYWAPFVIYGNWR